MQPATVGVARHTFRAMGTHVTLIAATDEPRRAFIRAAALTEAIFTRGERRFSRFRSGSELTRVNTHAGRPARVSEDFEDLVAFALRAARRTSGRFDPTVLGAVLAAGYDRDFDEVLAAARAALHPVHPCGRWNEIVLEERRITLPIGVGLDLGGVAKGWTVDRAADTAVAEGLSWAIVNAGGDLRLAGSPPAEGLEVGIEDPDSSEGEISRLALTGGALATSSVRRRAWAPGLHHLIDPTTGSPARTGIVQATVWAPTCAEAEVLAKDALLRGERALEEIPGVLVTADERIVTNLGSGSEVAA
jgi:thiamine biosynthesis lipoprotein